MTASVAVAVDDTDVDNVSVNVDHTDADSHKSVTFYKPDSVFAEVQDAAKTDVTASVAVAVDDSDVDNVSVNIDRTDVDSHESVNIDHTDVDNHVSVYVDHTDVDSHESDHTDIDNQKSVTVDTPDSVLDEVQGAAMNDVTTSVSVAVDHTYVDSHVSGNQMCAGSDFETSDSVNDPDYVPDDFDCSVSNDEDSSSSDEDECFMLSDEDSHVSGDELSSDEDAVETATNVKHTGSLTLLSKRQPKRGCKKSYDKIHYCLFCKKAIRLKMSRHLVSVHKDEERVQKCLRLPSKERVYQLQLLTNEGNFEHNIAAMSQGSGQIVIGRRSADEEKQVSNYTVCSFCKKWASKRNLWRHSKICKARIQYYQHSDETVRKSRLLAVKSGQSLIAKSVNEPDNELLNELVTRLKDDKVKEIVVADDLIKREAALRMCSLGRKEDRKQDDIYRVSQCVRTMGRILQRAKLTDPVITLHNLLIPDKFECVVKIGRDMSTDKEKPSLHVCKTVGNLLRSACDTKYCASLRTGDKKAQQDAVDFKKLVDTEWNKRVNRPAMVRVEKERRTRLPVIPITDDLKTFRDYLVQNIKLSMERLAQSQPQPQDWLFLAKCTMSRLILFNGRRRNEVRELRVAEYLSRPSWNNGECTEMERALSTVDNILTKR